MGHRLPEHDGKCRTLHGHTYHAAVTLMGPLEDQGSSHGMVADFSDVKKVLRELVGQLDHAMLLRYDDPAAEAVAPFANVLHFQWAPTTENIAAWMLGELQRRYAMVAPESAAAVVSVRVSESPWTSATAGAQ